MGMIVLLSFLSDRSVFKTLRRMCCEYCERWEKQERARNPHWFSKEKVNKEISHLALLWLAVAPLRNTPQIPLQNRDTEKIRKKWVSFSYFFSYFFCISVLEGNLGCISGCISGCIGGVLYFVWGTYDRNFSRNSHQKAHPNFATILGRQVGDFIKFKGFLLEFLENRRSWEKQKPPENRQKSGLFWASPFHRLISAHIGQCRLMSANVG